MYIRSLALRLSLPTAFALILGACAAQQTHEDALATSAEQNQGLPATKVEQSKPFSDDTLYAILVAELALERGKYELGLSNYLEQARATRDLSLTVRTTQIARILKRHDVALEMAQQWKQLDPGAREARLILIGEYTNARDYRDALQEVTELLRAGESAPISEIAVEASQDDKADLASLEPDFAAIANEFPNNVEALTGLSVVQLAAGHSAEALTSVNAALALAADDSTALYQRYRVLMQLGRTKEAAASYGKLVDLQPDNFRVRSHYARLLIPIDRTKALEQYEQLLEMAPDNEDIELNIGLLHQDLGDVDEAEKIYRELVARNMHADVAHYWLGEIAETRGDDAEALKHYLAIGEGKRYVDALAKAAEIMARKDGVDSAVSFLEKRREDAKNPQDKEDLFAAGAALLTQKGAYARATALYSEGLKEFADSINLRYGRAMSQVLSGDFKNAEGDFNSILKVDPNNAATLNAYGYTLADRNERLDQAHEMIQRALVTRPDDPAVLDSMGWVEFRLGHSGEALKYLEQAFSITQDHEIAAHFGEVLWREGKKKKARSVWNLGIQNNPDGKVIPATMERLGAN